MAIKLDYSLTPLKPLTLIILSTYHLLSKIIKNKAKLINEAFIEKNLRKSKKDSCNILLFNYVQNNSRSTHINFKFFINLRYVILVFILPIKKEQIS
jgi:hypothetical protein